MMRAPFGIGIMILMTLAGISAEADECVDCIMPVRATEAAQDGGIAVWTDKFSYDRDAIATIRGYSDTDEPITVVILNPMGNVAAVNQDTPTESGFFEVVVNLSGSYWEQEGYYSVTARAGPDSTPHTIHIGLGDVACDSTQMAIDAGTQGVHCIQYEQEGNIEIAFANLNIDTSTLTVETSGEGQSSITLHMPRLLLDSQVDQSDTAFVILDTDRDLIEYDEITEQENRTITIRYPPASYGVIEIHGTSAIPEFGAAIVSMAAALAIPLGWRLIKIHK